MKRKSFPLKKQSRRGFLKSVLALSVAPLIVPASVLGRGGAVSPNNQITFGIIGYGSRASAIVRNFLAFPEVRFLGVSDCRADRMQNGRNTINDAYQNQDCSTYSDFREMLARQDLDAVYIATGMRWHGMASMYAARAGKDVYSEKPVTLSMNEGRQLVECCKRFGTIYQGGTQRRGTGSYKFARQMVLEGKIGKLRQIEMQVWTGGAVGRETPSQPPVGWDWDMWLGQAPWHAYTPGFANGGWHYFWDTADGMMADMGCHYTDQMQWVLGRDHELPVMYSGKGVLPDPKQFVSDIPLTGEWHCQYADGVEGIMYQRAGFEDRYIKYIGDEGWIHVNDQTDEVTTFPESIAKLRSGGGVGWGDASSHIRNFLDCVRTRQQTDCNPVVAHHAMCIAQAWNIALRLGKTLHWDNATQQFDDATPNRMMYREPRAPWRI